MQLIPEDYMGDVLSPGSGDQIELDLEKDRY